MNMRRIETMREWFWIFYLLLNRQLRRFLQVNMFHLIWFHATMLSTNYA